jgi:DNA primase large subunit
MDSLHARYPFLPAARESVAAADADLAEVIDRGGAVVERAVTRVDHAVESRSVGDQHRSDRVELLSYPVARILVSLVDEPALVRRYASAEAQTAIDRLHADGDASRALRSVGGERLSVDGFLEAMNLDESIRSAGDDYVVDVETYLRLADGLDGASWRLVNRALADGQVQVSAVELDDLLAAAVEDRVAEDLPLAVPASIEAALSEQVTELRSMLADFSVERSFDAVEPALFPPCIQALAARVRDGGELPEHSRFAYVAFLAAIGMGREEIVGRLAEHPDVDPEAASYRVDHVVDRDGGAYLPPSCATMQAYGDCVNKDQLCARIAHPLEYYEKRLDGADPGEPQASRPESQ